MEQENDAQISQLAGKVSALRDISIQIGGHIKEDNRLLDDMGGTCGRVSALPRSGEPPSLGIMPPFPPHPLGRDENRREEPPAPDAADSAVWGDRAARAFVKVAVE